VTVTDPGPDGVPGGGDDGGPITYYDFDPAYAGPAFERFTYLNVPGYDDQYRNLEFGLEKRLSAGWQFQGSVLATKRDRWVTGKPVTPNEEFFPKDQTWESTIRLSGSYHAPWGILASGVYEYQSGAVQARDVLFRTGLQQLGSVTLRTEEIGAQRLDAVQLLNLRFGKRFNMRSAGRVTVSLDLYNALNENTATTVSSRSGVTYGRITSILPPRVARLGLTYGF
jgi:outer membrane receptor protein involved in Fe transport